jgi:hypothetical protein
MRRALVALGVAVVAGAALATWWMVGAPEVTVDALGDHVQTVARGRLPVFAEPGDLGRLYAFAAGNPDTLAWIPCTCGCGSLGHGSRVLREGRAAGAGHVHEPRRDLRPVPRHHA